MFTDATWRQFAKSVPTEYRDTLHFDGKKEFHRLNYSPDGAIPAP